MMHVATLSALEQLERRREGVVRGYAGTSAGALIAALAAVGYRSDDILRQGQDGGLTSAALSRNGKALTFGDLFPRRDRAILFAVKLFLKLGRWPKRFVILLGMVVIYFFAWAVSGVTGLVMLLLGLELAVPVWVCVGLLALVFLIYAVNVRGLMRMTLLHDVVNDALSGKLGLECLTFGDLRRQRRLLNIVVTDVVRSREFLFSSCDPSVDHVPVARAVLASCAIPILFRPIDIDGVSYVDGGLSSNLPAWVFDGQTVHDATALVVASVVHPAPEVFTQRLNTGGNAAYPKGRSAFFSNLFRSLLFGSNYLHVRNVRQFSSVQLPTEGIDLLDLDFRTIGRKLSGRKFSLARLVAQIQLARPFLESVRHQRIHDALIPLLQQQTDRGSEGSMRFRSSLVRGSLSDHPATSLFSVWNCIGFEGDGDRHSIVAGEGSLIQKALTSQQVIPVDFSVEADVDAFREIDRDHLLWDRKPDDIRWMMIVPLPDAGEPLDRLVGADFTLAQYSVAIVIDSSCPLDPHHPDIKSAIKQAVTGLWQGMELTNVRTGLAEKKT